MDVPAVQDAVDNYSMVVLSGTFDFGFDFETGGVDITRPDVTLQGPATILNGAKYKEFPELGGWNLYPISIQAPGVTVRDLTFSALDTGILIYVQEDGKPVVTEGNTVDAYFAPLFATATEGGIKVTDNTLVGAFCYYAVETARATEISDNEMQCYWDGVRIFPFNHKLDIINNSIGSVGLNGIWIGAWA